VTEKEIEEVKKKRQEEWEKVRRPDQPLGKHTHVKSSELGVIEVEYLWLSPCSVVRYPPIKNDIFNLTSKLLWGWSNQENTRVVVSISSSEDIIKYIKIKLP